MNNRICNFSRRLRLPNYFVGRTGSPPVHYDRGRRLFYSPSMQGHNPLGLNAYLNTRSAEVRASEETEDQRDIRLVSEHYAAGKKSLGACSVILAKIHQRGNWKKSESNWGRWCEKTFGFERSFSYALVRVPNTATKALREYYEGRDQSNHTNQDSPPILQPLRHGCETLSEPSKPTPKPQPQGPDSEEPPPTPRVRTEAGKPKRDLAIWGELRELIGKSGNRASNLNEQCPNPQRKKRLLAILDEARAELDAWWEETK